MASGNPTSQLSLEVEDNPLFPAAADELDGVEIGEIGEEIEDGLADLETYIKDSTEMSEQGEAPRPRACPLEPGALQPCKSEQRALPPANEEVLCIQRR